jgi:hypothetical protein
MLTREEMDRVYQQAYLPDHLLDYVAAILDAQPFLHADYLCFVQRKHLFFIGYPLGNQTEDITNAYDSAYQRFKPKSVTLIAPKIWLAPQSYESQQQDTYYRLDLPMQSLSPEVEYMVHRALKELKISPGNYGKEHRRIIKDFLSSHKLTDAQKHIFRNISLYLKKSSSARLLEARKEKFLVAFTIVDLGAADYAFYMFNFRSNLVKTPGASDLLFFEMVNIAQSEGKKAINLGLGINPGIRRFKMKWGGIPFLSHTSAVIYNKVPQLNGLLKKL